MAALSDTPRAYLMPERRRLAEVRHDALSDPTQFEVDMVHVSRYFWRDMAGNTGWTTADQWIEVCLEAEVQQVNSAGLP